MKSASSNLATCKVSYKNKKNLNLRPKIHYLDIFGLQFNKDYYQIFNQHPRICETINFHPKRKKKNELGTKKLYLGLWVGMLKNYCHIYNQRPSICVIAKFRAKTRIPKFGTKKPYLEVLGSNFEKPSSYLQPAPSNLLYCKVWCKK